MCIEKLVQKVGFGLAAFAIVAAFSAAVEYLPVISALAR